jgi:hypothetical protein
MFIHNYLNIHPNKLSFYKSYEDCVNFRNYSKVILPSIVYVCKNCLENLYAEKEFKINTDGGDCDMCCTNTNTLFEVIKKMKTNPELSRKASKRLSNAINWLVHLSKNQEVFEKKIKKRISFKINFITLTLPSPQIHSYILPCGFSVPTEKIQSCFPAANIGFGRLHYNTFDGSTFVKNEMTDNWIKVNLLNHFLTIMRTKYNVHHYVWRAESQGNGNIHIHITTNKYIYLGDVRKEWNKVLSKTNLIKEYQKKFFGISFANYKTIVDPNHNKKHQDLLHAWNHGNNTDWLDPNSTDIHSVKHVHSLGAYLATYFSKKNEARRYVRGNLWRLSYSISKLRCACVSLAGRCREEFDFLENCYKNKFFAHDYGATLFVNIEKVATLIENSQIIKYFNIYIDKIKKQFSFEL